MPSNCLFQHYDSLRCCACIVRTGIAMKQNHISSFFFVLMSFKQANYSLYHCIVTVSHFSTIIFCFYQTENIFSRRYDLDLRQFFFHFGSHNKLIYLSLAKSALAWSNSYNRLTISIDFAPHKIRY